MACLGPAPWPPAPIRTERLLLRCTERRDRAAFIDLQASPEVCRYLGGPKPRTELERTVSEIPAHRPGVFAVEADGAFLGMVSLARRDQEQPGDVSLEGGELELGYMFLPSSWGRGYAAEAAEAVLDWAAGALPGERVVLCTQTANMASIKLAQRLGFVELHRFLAHGAEQWLGVRPGRG